MFFLGFWSIRGGRGRTEIEVRNRGSWTRVAFVSKPALQFIKQCLVLFVQKLCFFPKSLVLFHYITVLQVQFRVQLLHYQLSHQSQHACLSALFPLPNVHLQRMKRPIIIYNIFQEVGCKSRISMVGVGTNSTYIRVCVCVMGKERDQYQYLQNYTHLKMCAFCCLCWEDKNKDKLQIFTNVFLQILNSIQYICMYSLYCS